ncbi:MULTISPECIES: MMPL family transporter [unclassified Fibrobacter]|uniref:MMPL family transporter n=1 Tax=unclassified Fibrobacter TaxID=2634177 RepID=UPI000D6AE0C5|nr:MULTISPECIES: MMPL family transporter [unclassified Fibrobacter]PWJ59801.1 putative RND superfamily exporter protein [Fibrobacter sp. UWR4]PZW63756.1 putative RND superfamily exporter protein [Fibrobacter sp. UWR1]
MYSAIAKIIRGLAAYPRAVALFLLALAILSIYPVRHLRWDLQLQDAFNGNDFQMDYESIEDAFGGLGSLTVVFQSGDSLKNYLQAEKFAQVFQKDTLVNFIEYAADVQFYEKNKLLYASEDDLSKVLTHIESFREKENLKHNPFYVELEEPADTPQVQQVAGGFIRQVEEKYFRNLQQSFSNPDGTVRVIDIYPTQSLSDLQANRVLYHRVLAYMKENVVPAGIQVYYGGKVYQSVLTGRTLLPEAKFAGGMAVLFFLLLLGIHFYKQPQLIPISAIPMALPLLFMLSAAYFLYGRVSLFTMVLMLLLPGHACQILVHIHTRYYHERLQKLSPALCLESALLGVGPAVASSSLIMAGLFLSLNLVPLPGLREFANLGAIGAILNLFICPVLATATLKYMQRNKSFNVGSHIHRPFNIPLIPSKINWIIIFAISAVSLVGLVYGGFNLNFLYDFRQTEFKHHQTTVDSLISTTGFSTYDPIIIMMPDSSYNNKLMQDFNHLQERGRIPDLGRIYTQYQFLPKESQSKKNQIDYLKHQVSPEVLGQLGVEDSTAIVNMLSSYETDFREFELSQNITRKFSDKHGNSGVFAFIVPTKDPNNGLACRHIYRQLQQLEDVQDKKFKICGTPVLRALVLDTILSNVGKSIVLGSIILWLLLLLFINNLNRAIFIMLPSMFALSWLTVILYGMNFHISVYSALSFVLVIGASVDGSLQLWSSYFEKPTGTTAVMVLQTKLSSVLVGQIAAILGPVAMIFSSHPGIRNMGQVTLIGLVCIIVAQLTIYPLIAGALDQHRLRKKQRLEHESTLQ